MSAGRPRLGQHFLRSEKALRRIAAAADPRPGKRIVEVGPGRGALTDLLVASGASVVAVEVDSELAQGLRERFAKAENFELVEADILDVDLEGLCGERAVVVGNLPYYITSPIVRKTLAAGARIESAVFLVQFEVAERIVARKNSRDYGYFSVLCRLHSEPELLFRVPAKAFQPPPRVESAVIRLTPKQGEAPAEFVRFLEAAFRQPRKTLRNNLSALYGRDKLGEHPRLGLRAQQLDVDELLLLWRDLNTTSVAKSSN